jgi:hypothetical protein
MKSLKQLRSMLIEDDSPKKKYTVSFKSLKKRMGDAHQRNKRQKKIDKLQSTNQWSGLE